MDNVAKVLWTFSVGGMWAGKTHLQVNGGAIITDENVILSLSKDLLIDRGYTSHEHFAEVGLMHMNGRLYDPLLRRFLNADETEGRGSPIPLKKIKREKAKHTGYVQYPEL